MKPTTVSVFGLGYIGLPTATVIASRGVNVVGVDVTEHVVNSVNEGKLHIVEPKLGELLADVVQKGFLRATMIPEPADAFLIAVPTPFKNEHKPDLSHIQAVAQSLAPVLQKGNVVILESTSPVGTTEQLAAWLAEARPDLSFPQQAANEADVQVAYCPERVLPGKVLQELVDNDRVIGGMSEKASSMAAEVYSVFVKGDLSFSNSRTAEMCKLTENSFRDVNIAFANELSLICDELGINVWELIKLSNKHPRVNILNPGCGVGGHCIAVDPWFIVDSCPSTTRLIKTARVINDSKPQWVIDKIIQKTKIVADRIPKIAIWGITFKPNSDDIRNSPAMLIVEKLLAHGFDLIVVDPYVKDLPSTLKGKLNFYNYVNDEALSADLQCVLVNHTEFYSLTDFFNTQANTIDISGLLFK